MHGLGVSTRRLRSFDAHELTMDRANSKTLDAKSFLNQFSLDWAAGIFMIVTDRGSVGTIVDSLIAFFLSPIVFDDIYNMYTD